MSDLPADTKRCCRCKETLPILAFGINRDRKDGRADECKACRQGLDRDRNAAKAARHARDVEAGKIPRGDEWGKYKEHGSVSLCAELPHQAVMGFFIATHGQAATPATSPRKRLPMCRCSPQRFIRSRCCIHRKTSTRWRNQSSGSPIPSGAFARWNSK